MNASYCRELWSNLRAASILACILMIAFFTVSLCAHTFDCEGPSGEAIILEQTCRDQDNKEAFERVQEGKEQEGDVEKTITYLNEHLCRHLEQFKAKRKQAQ